MKTTVKFIFNLYLLNIIFCINSYSQVSPIVHIGSIALEMKSPVRIATDNMNNIYVSDAYRKSITRFDADGNYLDHITVPIAPVSIAIDQTNQLFVGDEASGGIYKVSQAGQLTLFYSGCAMPSAMVFSPDGLLFVVDSKLKRVVVLDISANVVRYITAGTFIYPTTIAYDSRNDRILVGEHGGIGDGMVPPCKIWKFKTDGTYLGSFGSGGNGNGKFYRIQGITIGKCGNIYVNDAFQGKITVFSESNVFLTKFGTFGDTLSKLNVPMDIIFDSRERILVTSLNNGAIELYNVQDTLPTANMNNPEATICAGDTADIKVYFTGSAPWTFTYTQNDINPVTVTTSDNPYTIKATTAGNYKITALADSAKSGTCFTGNANIFVSGVIPTSEISDNPVLVCSGQPVTIPVNLTGTGPWTFTYTKNNIDSVTVTTANNPYFINVVDSGIYRINTLSASGCIGTTMNGATPVSVRQVPTSVITNGNMQISLCGNETVNLFMEFTGSGPWTFTYTINDSDSVSFVTSSSPFVLNTATPGIYSITSVSDSFCTSTVSIGHPELINRSLPTAVLSNISDTVCNSQTIDVPINFTGTAPWTVTYQINGADAGSYIQINSTPFYLHATDSGMYTLSSVTDAYCNGTDFSGSAELNVIPTPSVYLGFDINLCDTQTTVLNAGITDGTYLWNNGNTNQTLFVNSPGTYSVQVTNAFGCVGSDEINVSAYPLPFVSLGNDTGICENQSIVLDAGLQNSYLWNDGSYGQSITVFASGTYTVVVTDMNGCSNTDQKIVNVNPLPVVNLGPDQSICAASAILDAGSSFVSYLWNDGSVSQTLLVNTSGTYNVQITDNNGCSKTDEIVILLNTLPSVNLGNDIAICAGQSATLDAGSSFASYLWSDGSVNQTLSVNTPGTYSVQITDNSGCTNYDELIVVVNFLPVVNLGSDIVICEGQSAMLDAGAGSTSYFWNDASVNQTLLVSAAGVYNVQVTDYNGCTNTDEINISVNSLPAVSLGNDITLCQNQSVLLDAGTGFSSYFWNDGSASQTLTVNTSATYNVVVTDNNGCSNTDEIVVTVNTLPVINLGSDISFCTGQSALLDAGSGFTQYLWNDASTNQTLSVNTAGTYSVQVTDNNGCSEIDEILVSENALPVISLGSDIILCQGQSAILNAGTGFTNYLWDDASTNQTRIVNTTGTYNVQVTDINGCNNTDEITVTVNLIAIPSFTYASNSLDIYLTNSSQNANAYLWNFGDGQTSTEINPAHTYPTSGTYLVSLTASNPPCNDSIFSQSVQIIEVGTNNVNVSNSISIYPNPAKGNVTINVTNNPSAMVQVIIYNAIGQEIYTAQINGINAKQEIDLSLYSAGIYTIKLQINNFIKTSKLVIINK